jgi:hypothetical protein
MKTTEDIIEDAWNHCCRYYNFKKAHVYNSNYFLAYDPSLLDYKYLHGYTQDSYNQFLRILKHFIRVKHDAKNILYLPKYLKYEDSIYMFATININTVVYTDIIITKKFIEECYMKVLDDKSYTISDILKSLLKEGLNPTRISPELNEYLSNGTV